MPALYPTRPHGGSGASPALLTHLSGELATDCPAEFAASITQARCISPCAAAYQTGMANCEDGCAPYEEQYDRCLQRCGTSLQDFGLPDVH